MVEMFGHALESLGRVSKWEANGLTCHIVIPSLMAKTMEHL